ncbi:MULTISPECIES: hypothetical protein [unclassified Microbacterium]
MNSEHRVDVVVAPANPGPMPRDEAEAIDPEVAAAVVEIVPRRRKR